MFYVKEKFSANKAKLQNQFPEQVWCKTKINDNRALFVGVCYRTPSDSVYGHDIRYMTILGTWLRRFPE